METFKESTPLWAEVVRTGLSSASAKLSSELAGLLIENGKLDLLKFDEACSLRRESGQHRLPLPSSIPTSSARREAARSFPFSVSFRSITPTMS